MKNIAKKAIALIPFKMVFTSELFFQDFLCSTSFKEVLLFIYSVGILLFEILLKGMIKI